MHAPWTHLDPPAAYQFSTMINTASVQLHLNLSAQERLPRQGIPTIKQTAARAAPGATQRPREEDAHVGFVGT